LSALSFKHLRFSRHPAPAPPALLVQPGSVSERAAALKPRDPVRRRWSRRRVSENLRCLKPEAYKIRRSANPTHRVFRWPAAEIIAEGGKETRGH
jgi:hypothetical protein